MSGYVILLCVLLPFALVIYQVISGTKTHAQQFIHNTLPALEAVQMAHVVNRQMELSAYSLYGYTVKLAQFDQMQARYKKKTG